MSPIIRRSLLVIWSYAYLLSEAEPSFFRHLPRFLAKRTPDWPVKETVSIDVGASVGVYTRAFCKWCPQVIAMEPSKSMSSHLLALQLPGVTVVEAAAGARAEQGLLTDCAQTGWRRPEAKVVSKAREVEGLCDDLWTQNCQVQRLDKTVELAIGKLPAALVVKIDVEGSEAEVLAGMGALLDIKYLILLVEIESRHNPDPAQIFTILEASGLFGHKLVNGRLVRASSDEIIANAGRKGGKFARLRGYRNNFVFLRTKSETV